PHSAGFHLRQICSLIALAVLSGAVCYRGLPLRLISPERGDFEVGRRFVTRLNQSRWFKTGVSTVIICSPLLHKPMSDSISNLRHVPSVDQLLRTDEARRLRDSIGVRRLTAIA